MLDTSYGGVEDVNGWFDDVLSNDAFQFPTSMSPVSPGKMAMSNSYIPQNAVEELIPTMNEDMNKDATPRQVLSEPSSPESHDWLGNLGQLSGELFVHRTCAKQPETAFQHSVSAPSSPKQEHKDSIFSLASRYSSLVEAITPDDGRQSSSLVALGLLRDQTNSMLLSSTYMRLLGIFSDMLRSLENQLSRPEKAEGLRNVLRHASVEVHCQDLANQPVAEAFLFVSITQFHIHRIGRNMERLMGPVAKRVLSEGEMQDGRRQALRVIPAVVFERQALLLNDIEKMKGWLLDTRGP